MTQKSAGVGPHAERLERMARLMREAGPSEVSPTEHEDGRARLVAAVARARGSAGARRARGRLRSAAWIAAAALALLAVFAIVRGAARPAPLAYVVERAASSGGYVRAEAQPAVVRFSEGTVIELVPPGRARVAEVTPRGARVSLESGRAAVRVQPLPDAAWSVEAGPFVIGVTGTEFEVAWSASEERLEVRLFTGSVIVKGPPAPAGVALAPGQRLLAYARGKMLIESDEPRSTRRQVIDTPSSTPAPPSASDAESAAPAQPAPRPSAPPPTWGARVARGEFAEVVREAEARGLEATIAGATLADLSALADAGRYAGRSDVARRALEAQRARFPGSSEARAASFFLGLLADDRGASAAAIEHFDRYLAEAPSGAFAAEALGRKMVATRRAAGATAARPVAEEYLRRFPQGAYAKVAEELTRAP
jgi:ferric-dicitrate binding protein FerR (iron transport regulator)/TolA-binding protein